MLAPTPVETPHDKPYWDAAREGVLLLAPGGRSPGWGSDGATDPAVWRRSAGLGRVFTYTVVERSFYENVPAGTILAVVELDEGVRVTAHVIEAADGIAIGQRVRARFVDRDGMPLLVFAPDDAA